MSTRLVHVAIDAIDRIHLDIRPLPGEDPAAAVAKLRAAGAASADVGQGDAPWTVLADPEGSEFCVLAPAEDGP